MKALIFIACLVSAQAAQAMPAIDDFKYIEGKSVLLQTHPDLKSGVIDKDLTELNQVTFFVTEEGLECVFTSGKGGLSCNWDKFNKKDQ